MLNDGRPYQFILKDGFPSDFVQSLLLDEAHGVLWIGTFRGGLNRLKEGRFPMVNAHHGLRDNAVCHIQDSEAGNCWLSAYGGIHRVSGSEQERCAGGQPSCGPMHCA